MQTPETGSKPSIPSRLAALAALAALCCGPAAAQITEPPEPQSCPEGLRYNLRDDACVPPGTATEDRPAWAETGRAPDGWPPRMAECVLQHIDRAHVGPAVDAIIRACRALAPDQPGGS